MFFSIFKYRQSIHLVGIIYHHIIGDLLDRMTCPERLIALKQSSPKPIVAVDYIRLAIGKRQRALKMPTGLLSINFKAVVTLTVGQISKRFQRQDTTALKPFELIRSWEPVARGHRTGRYDKIITHSLEIEFQRHIGNRKHRLAVFHSHLWLSGGQIAGIRNIDHRGYLADRLQCLSGTRLQGNGHFQIGYYAAIKHLAHIVGAEANDT